MPEYTTSKLKNYPGRAAITRNLLTIEKPCLAKSLFYMEEKQLKYFQLYLTLKINCYE